MQKETYTIANLEKYTEVSFSNNYAHHFGIAICILDDNICPSRYFLLLMNTPYYCIITWVILSQNNDTAQDGCDASIYNQFITGILHSTRQSQVPQTYSSFLSNVCMSISARMRKQIDSLFSQIYSIPRGNHQPFWMFQIIVPLCLKC